MVRKPRNKLEDREMNLHVVHHVFTNEIRPS